MFNIIPPQVAFTGPDGRIAREWYQFLLQIFQATGGGTAPVTLGQLESLYFGAVRSPSTTAVEAGLKEVASVLQLQRSERAAITALTQRVADLEELLQSLRPPVQTISVANFNGGISASTATFLRGDGTWSSTLTGSFTANAIIPSGSAIPTNGMYLPAANTLGWATASALGMSLDPVGNFGVGGTPNANGAGTTTLTVNNVTTPIIDFNVNGVRTASLLALASTCQLKTVTNIPLTFGTNNVIGMTMDTSQNLGIGLVPSGTYKLEVNGALSVSSATLLRTATTLTNNAGAAAGTLTNAPAAGNPTKWIPINDNGTVRNIPAW